MEEPYASLDGALADAQTSWGAIQATHKLGCGAKTKAARERVKADIRRRAGEWYVNDFSLLAGRIRAVLPAAFAGLPPIPPHRRLTKKALAQVLAECGTAETPEGYYDVAHVAFVHFRVRDTRQCALRFIFWAVIAANPGDYNENIGVAGYIRDWAGGLIVETPENQGLWRTLGQPMEWAIKAFRALAIVGTRPQAVTSKPGYPKPSVERLNLASRQLAEVEQYIAPESAVLVSLLVRALLARNCTTAEAMWASFTQIEAGRYEAVLLGELSPAVTYIVSEANRPAGLNVENGVLHIDGEAGNWGLLVILLPRPSPGGTITRSLPMAASTLDADGGEQEGMPNLHRLDKKILPAMLELGALSEAKRVTAAQIAFHVEKVRGGHSLLSPACRSYDVAG